MAGDSTSRPTVVAEQVDLCLALSEADCFRDLQNVTQHLMFLCSEKCSCSIKINFRSFYALFYTFIFLYLYIISSWKQTCI